MLHRVLRRLRVLNRRVHLQKRDLVGGYEWWTSLFTWIDEEGTLLLWSGRCVLDHSEACLSGGVIVVVHRNLKSSALQVGVCGIDCEAPTATPSDLQDIQKDR